jgi:hypothetical protein
MEDPGIWRKVAAMKRLVAFGLLTILAMLSACRETRSGLIVGAGTLFHSVGECNGWFIDADSGRFYELRDLAPEFQWDQVRVRFTLKERHDAVSTCMRGPIADVVTLQKL